MLNINMRAVLMLTYEFGQRMRTKRRGGIILVSSTVSGTGAPFNANYAATKSYDLVLGEGLRYELRKAGVAVQVLMPGGTRTEGSSRMMQNAPGYMDLMMMNPQPVVAASLNKLGKKTTVIPGHQSGDDNNDATIHAAFHRRTSMGIQDAKYVTQNVAVSATSDANQDPLRFVADRGLPILLM